MISANYIINYFIASKDLPDLYRLVFARVYFFSIYLFMAHIVFIAIERALAVFLPIRFTIWFRRRKPRNFVIALWLFTGILMALYEIWVQLTGASHLQLRRRVSASVVLAFGSLVLLLYMYIAIAVTRSEIKVKSRTASTVTTFQDASTVVATGVSPKMNKSRRAQIRNTLQSKTTRTCLMISLSYVICTFPYVSLWFRVDAWSPHFLNAYRISLMVWLSQSVLTPIFYVWGKSTFSICKICTFRSVVRAGSLTDTTVFKQALRRMTSLTDSRRTPAVIPNYIIGKSCSMDELIQVTQGSPPAVNVKTV